MTTGEQAIQLQQQSTRRQKLRRFLTLTGLLGPALFFLIFVFGIALVMLFSNSVFEFTGLRIDRSTITLEAYTKFFTDPFFAQVVAEGFQLGVITSIGCLLLGYPTAYAMSRVRSQRLLLIAYIVIFSPLLTSVVVRSYGWLLILANNGVVNYLLVVSGIVEEPVRMLFNFFGVAVALIHILLPFTVFPIVSVLNQMDPALKEAGADLGANRFRTFWNVTLPLSLPGVFAAFQLTFVLSMTAFVTPRMLGGGRVLVLPIMIFQNIADLNWPLASVQAMVLLGLVLGIVWASNLLFKRLYQGPGS